MKAIGTTIAVLAGIAVFCLLCWGLDLVYVAEYGNVAPKMANAQREVFENSNSYVLGAEQQINKLKLEYEQTKDPISRTTLRSAILTEADKVDWAKFKPRTVQFLQSIK